MKNKFCIFLLLCLISMPGFCEEKIGKINLAIITALHPLMTRFDFYKIGFYLDDKEAYNKEFSNKMDDIIQNAQNKHLETRDISELEKEQIIIEDDLHDFLSKKNAHFYSELSDEAKEEYMILYAKWQDAYKRTKSVEFSKINPNLTNPYATKEILNFIENEIQESIKYVSNQKQLEVVLSSTIPSPYGYSNDNYSEGKEFYTGYVSRSLYYALLSMKPFDKLEKSFSKEYANEWIMQITNPQISNILPIKPYPLVISGGTSISCEVLKVIYEKYSIDNNLYEIVSDLLSEMDI